LPIVVDVVEIASDKKGSPCGGPFVFHDASHACGHNLGTGNRRHRYWLHPPAVSIAKLAQLQFELTIHYLKLVQALTL
jgi:hypothetical protein